MSTSVRIPRHAYLGSPKATEEMVMLESEEVMSMAPHHKPQARICDSEKKTASPAAAQASH